MLYYDPFSPAVLFRVAGVKRFWTRAEARADKSAKKFETYIYKELLRHIKGEPIEDSTFKMCTHGTPFVLFAGCEELMIEPGYSIFWDSFSDRNVFRSCVILYDCVDMTVRGFGQSISAKASTLLTPEFRAYQYNRAAQHNNPEIALDAYTEQYNHITKMPSYLSIASIPTSPYVYKMSEVGSSHKWNGNRYNESASEDVRVIKGNDYDYKTDQVLTAGASHPILVVNGVPRNQLITELTGEACSDDDRTQRDSIMAARHSASAELRIPEPYTRKVWDRRYQHALPVCSSIEPFARGHMKREFLFRNVKCQLAN